MEDIRWRHKDAAAGLLVGLITVLAFAPSAGFGFVDWDDLPLLVHNPHFRGFGLQSLRWMWTTFHMGHYVPLTWMSFALDFSFWGMNPAGYHLTNVLIHGANAGVFFILLLSLLKRASPSPSAAPPEILTGGAALGALFFSLHPLRVESVAWVTERRDVLAGLFLLLTVLFYVHEARDTGEKARSWYRWSLACFTLSLLSKASGIVLPVVLLVLDVYPLRRANESMGTRRWIGRLWREKWPFFALALTATGVAGAAQTHAGAAMSWENYRPAARFMQISFGSLFYLWKTVWPTDLAPFYPFPDASPWTPRFIVIAAASLGTALLFMAQRNRRPALTSAWLIYILFFLPTSGIFQSGPQFTADRYSYFSCLSWAAVLGGLPVLLHAEIKSPGRRRGAWAASFLVVGILAVKTLDQLEVWRTSETLWARAVETHPRSAQAHEALAKTYSADGRFPLADRHFGIASSLAPRNGSVQFHWGVSQAARGRPDRAIECYRRAILLDPNRADAENNLGALMLAGGDTERSLTHFQRAVFLDPRNALARRNLARTLWDTGSKPEALQNGREAVRLDPRDADNRVQLGVFYYRSGRTDEAVGEFRKALEIRPEDAAALNNLGAALLVSGRPMEAKGCFLRALQGDPRNAEALANLKLIDTEGAARK
jgi:protein O-mannosyl-transferase